MVKIELLKLVYKNFTKDFTSINDLSQQCFYSNNYIWQTVRVLKAMGLIEEKFNEHQRNQRTYKFKNDFKMDFLQFIEFVLERL